MGFQDDLIELLDRIDRDPKTRAFLAAEIAKRDARATYLSGPGQVELLKELVERFLEPSVFKVGDLIKWKVGLKNRRLPDYGVPMVVVEVIDPPVIDESRETASQYYREHLDIRGAFLDEEGELLTYHFEARRFEPF
jgi:hypothetical protein